MKQSNPISLAYALKIFSEKDKKGMYAPFNLDYRTFNSTTKKGGRLIEYRGVKYLPSAIADSKKDPHHSKNRTRNIELPNGDIKKINIDFIISVNNQTVIL